MIRPVLLALVDATGKELGPVVDLGSPGFLTGQLAIVLTHGSSKYLVWTQNSFSGPVHALYFTSNDCTGTPHGRAWPDGLTDSDQESAPGQRNVPGGRFPDDDGAARRCRHDHRLHATVQSEIQLRRLR